MAVTGELVNTSLLAVAAVTVMLVPSAILARPLAVNVSFKPVCASVGAASPLNVATPLTAVTVNVPVNGPVPVPTVAVTTVLLSPVNVFPEAS